MMNMSQNIHGVTKVRAVLMTPDNSNAVTIKIETEGGQVNQTFYFGNTIFDAGRANAFFYALGGDPADVAGSREEAARENGK